MYKQYTDRIIIDDHENKNIDQLQQIQDFIDQITVINELTEIREGMHILDESQTDSPLSSITDANDDEDTDLDLDDDDDKTCTELNQIFLTHINLNDKEMNWFGEHSNAENIENLNSTSDDGAVKWVQCLRWQHLHCLNVDSNNDNHRCPNSFNLRFFCNHYFM